MIIRENDILKFKFKSKQFEPYEDYICNFVNDLSKILLDESSYLISYVTSSFLTLEHMDLANKKSLDTTSGIKNNENISPYPINFTN